jgi:hypothetical protein
VNFRAFLMSYKSNDNVLYRPIRFFARNDVTFEIYEFTDVALMPFLSSQECIAYMKVYFLVFALSIFSFLCCLPFS